MKPDVCGKRKGTVWVCFNGGKFKLPHNPVCPLEMSAMMQ